MTEDTKACTPCAKARRRCSKQRPRCVRCRTRGLDCNFPPDRPSSYIILGACSEITKAPSAEPQPQPFDHNHLCLTPTSPCDQLQVSWFASSDTWMIDTVATTNATADRRSTPEEFNHVLSTAFYWLSEWTQHGSNPFIHQELYRQRMPRCLQDVYMSLSSYLHKTPGNQQMIYNILEEQIMRLIAEEDVSRASTPRDRRSPPHALDPLESLGKIHALLVHQCIGLYDGNIRLRCLAEQHIPTLERWLVTLTAQISQASNCGESLTSTTPKEDASNASATSPVPSQNTTWHSWILIESTRRTWLIAAGIQGIYKLLCNIQGGCLGSTMFTSRQGFWEATSACEWEQRCTETYSGLVRITEMAKMFAMVPKHEINEFTRLVIQCTYGIEQATRWGVGP